MTTGILHAPSTVEMMDPAVAARFMNNYARRYSAGAFATPTREEVRKLAAAGNFLIWEGGCAAVKHLKRDSVRKDFTGRDYVLPGGEPIITHIAVGDGGCIPDLSPYSTVYAYREDDTLNRRLSEQRREVRAVRVSAASEIIGAWGRQGRGFVYPEWDGATVRQITDFHVPATLRARILEEVAGLSGWLDDFPFYSDGSWSALNLRGFKPDDPSWGIKPSEMSKSWWAEHPEAKALTHCDWTVLATQVPSVVELVKSMEWFGRLERVRLLQMSGRGGKGGKLSRHSDVTDRAAGTRDGYITRFHIPLVTHPDIVMRAWNLDGHTAATHLPAWTCWYLDARKPHAVTNPTGVDRIHLVVDTFSDQIIRDRISNGREFVETPDEW